MQSYPPWSARSSRCSRTPLSLRLSVCSTSSISLARSFPPRARPSASSARSKETLLFAALVYWLFTFTFSRISLRMEKKLGVGER